MIDMSLVKTTFDDLATNGFIGNPDGQLAYAYIRVSDPMQAEEGSSGLIRQVQNIHKAASSEGYRIPWNLLYADDSSGFDLDERENLTHLRNSYKSSSRPAQAIIMEDIDRLSRHSDWHQGFLLDEMGQCGIKPIFFMSIASRIERMVKGAIAQDGMELAKARMREGTLNKARSGRVTAKVAAFGYKLVDPEGNANTTDARKMTHYRVDEDRRIVIKFIFEGLAYHGLSAYELMKQLDEQAIVRPCFLPPRSLSWNERTLVKMIRNPLYKGEYIANRFYNVKVRETDERGSTKITIKERKRPESDWIHVPVPAIVDEQTWELANRNLYRNKGFAPRNKKNTYLLTSLVRCATCGWNYVGMTDSKPGHIQRYYCSKIYKTPSFRANHPCNQRSIHCSKLDEAVWNVILSLITDPLVLNPVIDAYYTDDTYKNLNHQLSYIEKQIEERERENSKLYQAFLASAYTPDEYAGERKRVNQQIERLHSEYQKCRSQILTPEEVAEKKAVLVDTFASFQNFLDIRTPPFSVKQKIVRLLVDEIKLNVNQNCFEMKGEFVSGIYQWSEGSVVRTSSL